MDEAQLKKRINTAFIRELEAFRAGGYKFNNGSNKELFEGTQREAFDAYLDGGPFEFRIAKLSEFIASKELTAEQKQEACGVINTVLKTELATPLTPKQFKDPNEVGTTLAKAIATKYKTATPKAVHAFLNAIQNDDNALPEYNPLKNFKSLDGIKGGLTEGYFEIPTGVGKTALFIAIIGCYLRATEKIPEAPKVLIHEPTVDLVVQTALAFADFMPNLVKEMAADDDKGREIDFLNSDVEIHYGRRKGAKNDHRVLITTYQSQAAEERKVELADTFKFQVQKLCRFIASRQLTEEQRQEACDAINTSLAHELSISNADTDEEAREPITPTSIRRSAKILSEAIQERYSNAPDLKEFLRAIKADVSPSNPLKSYQTKIQQDKEAAIEGRNFKMEDFGFVIHDEAHYVTGAKYGPAAVDKFHGAIQLGVTATPEYSDDKTVANKLAHRYYELPLNTAIERGDLCHVRPMLIKTKFKGRDRINLEQAREFLQERHGRPLSDNQLEALFNQAARNKAIIKAYLTGKHPDTGIRFLGETGQVFAGGTRHCDDFIRQAESVLSQPAYRPIKRWLRDEGLALIAPVHGAIPKEGIRLTVGGEKRLYTEDEIKELHRRGKILLLVSDQKLKLGSDYPRDSFVVDAVDRFSVPDAAQRMGRGFRVDRGNPRYHYPGNPDKSCAAINVIDETTHDMYQDTPHYPIHALEILHGAVHRPPMRRQHAMTSRQFRENPPEVSESMDQLGFEFISRVEALRGVAKKFEEGKKKPLPDKTDDDLTLAREVPAELGISHTTKKYLNWRTHIEARLDKGETIEIGGYPILKMQPKLGAPIYCLNRKALPALAEQLAVSPRKTKNDLSLKRELPEELEIDPKGPKYMDWRTQVEADMKAGKIVKVGGYPIRQMLGAHGDESYCLDHRAMPAVAKQLGIIITGDLPKKTKHDLAIGKELPRALGINPDNEKYITWRTQVEADMKAGKIVKVGGYAFQQMKSGKHKPYCLDDKAIPALKVDFSNIEDQGFSHANKVKKRPINPSSDHLKRKGRGRGREGDE